MHRPVMLFTKQRSLSRPLGHRLKKKERKKVETIQRQRKKNIQPHKRNSVQSQTFITLDKSLFEQPCPLPSYSRGVIRSTYQSPYIMEQIVESGQDTLQIARLIIIIARIAWNCSLIAVYHTIDPNHMLWPLFTIRNTNALSSTEKKKRDAKERNYALFHTA